MGFTSVVSACFPIFVTALNYRESGSYRDAGAGALVYPAVLGVYKEHNKSGFCFLTTLSGYSHLVFIESDMCMSEPASSIAPDRIFLVRSFPNLISTLKAISMVFLLPLSFFNISVRQIVHAELEMAAPFPHWVRNTSSPQHRSVLFAVELG